MALIDSGCGPCGLHHIFNAVATRAPSCKHGISSLMEFLLVLPRLRNDLDCVGWDVKLYSLSLSLGRVKGDGQGGLGLGSERGFGLVATVILQVSPIF